MQHDPIYDKLGFSIVVLASATDIQNIHLLETKLLKCL